MSAPWHARDARVVRQKSESPWRVAALVYTAVAILALGAAVLVRDGRPFEHPAPWLSVSPSLGAAASAALGVLLAVLGVASARLLVARFAWARRLHAELRPFARGMKVRHVVLIAVLSSAAEELFFRALLGPALGLLASSALFGLAHLLRGQSRWVWPAWAAVVGLGLGAIFQLTGSLLGPLLAHALINGFNLAFLRDTDPDATSPLGGLLRRQQARARF